MAIPYYPRVGQVLTCDFKGFREPEMVKSRPVIILSPLLRNRRFLATVVPISTSPPRHEVPFAVRLSRNYRPTRDDVDISCWAKCDMITTISTDRLRGFRVSHRQWVDVDLSAEDLEAVKAGVLYGLGFSHLIDK